jgi:Zn-dependent M16 (insulinase) family peptidase
LAENLFTQDNLCGAVVGNSDALLEYRDKYSSFVSRLKSNATRQDKLHSPGIVKQSTTREVLFVPTTVSHVAQAIKVPSISNPISGKIRVMAAALSEYVLHAELREKGGAYGGIVRYSPEHGVLYLISIMDSDVLRTLNVFDSACSRLLNTRLGKWEINNTIVRCLGEVDSQRSPSGAAKKDICNYLSGVTKEHLAQYRHAILTCTHSEIIDAAKQVLGTPASIAVITSREIWKRLELESFSEFSI